MVQCDIRGWLTCLCEQTDDTKSQQSGRIKQLMIPIKAKKKTALYKFCLAPS